MPVSSYIRGTSYANGGEKAPGAGVRVADAGSMLVTQQPIPRRDYILSDHPGPFQRAFLSAFATSAGSTALNVNGSVTNVSFRINSTPSLYRVIKRIVIYIEDELMNAGTAEVRRFGSAAVAPGLTNGILHRVNYSGVLASIVFPAAVQSIADYVVFTDTTNIVDGVSAGVDILSPSADLVVPVELVPEKTDYVEILIRDNLTAVNSMVAYAIGYEEDA